LNATRRFDRVAERGRIARAQVTRLVPRCKKIM
jgi:hypothetical protein